MAKCLISCEPPVQAQLVKWFKDSPLSEFGTCYFEKEDKLYVEAKDLGELTLQSRLLTEMEALGFQEGVEVTLFLC